MLLSQFFFSFIENVCALGNSYKIYHIIFVMVAEQQSCDHILTDISNIQTVLTQTLGLRQSAMMYRTTLINQNLSSHYSDKASY